MTEDDYCLVTNLTLVRAAVGMLEQYEEVNSEEDVLAAKASSALYHLQDSLEKRMATRLAGYAEDNDQTAMD